MSFLSVWVFTAVIMVCVIADKVEAQYRFPKYYRIVRRMEGDNQGVQDNILLDNCPTCEAIVHTEDKKADVTFGHCSDCRSVPLIEVSPKPNDEGSIALGVIQSQHTPRTEDRSRSEEEHDKILLQPIRRRSPNPPSWRLEENEDNGNWIEKQAIIQQFLLKSWTDWNKDSERGNEKEDFNQ